jgi:diadenosine tetraphosphate (Ap4A) HIT family hydrolase
VAAAENCPFCEDVLGPSSLFDKKSPIDEQGEFLFKPALGMMMPGYLLAITRDHKTSFAQLGREKLANIDRHLVEYEHWLSERFGRYFRIESGSDNLKDCGSGGCIEHAHIHVVPADEDVGPYVQEQLPWQKLEAYEDLTDFKGEPYIYLGRLASHYVVPNPRLPSQWVRRQIATVRGLEDWDWAIDPNENNLNITLDKLVDFPLEIFHGDNNE